MLKQKILIGLIAVVTLFVVGCNSVNSNPNIRQHQQDTVNTEHPRMRLVLGSKDLVGNVALVDVRVGAAGNLTRAEVTVQNLTNARYTLEYMFRWEDKQGFSVNGNPVWSRFVLAPRELKSFQTIGKTPDAYAATITVRLPDDIFIHQEKNKD